MAADKKLIVVAGCVQVDKAYNVGDVLPKLDKGFIAELIKDGYAAYVADDADDADAETKATADVKSKAKTKAKADAEAEADQAATNDAQTGLSLGQSDAANTAAESQENSAE